MKVKDYAKNIYYNYKRDKSLIKEEFTIYVIIYQFGKASVKVDYTKLHNYYCIHKENPDFITQLYEKCNNLEVESKSSYGPIACYKHGIVSCFNILYANLADNKVNTKFFENFINCWHVADQTKYFCESIL